MRSIIYNTYLVREAIWKLFDRCVNLLNWFIFVIILCDDSGHKSFRVEKKFTSIKTLCSVTGLYFVGLLTKTGFCSCSAYGEGLFIAVQTWLIAYLVLYYGGNQRGGLVFSAVYGLVVFFLLSPFAPPSLLWFLQASIMPNLVVARVSRIPVVQPCSTVFYYVEIHFSERGRAVVTISNVPTIILKLTTCLKIVSATRNLSNVTIGITFLKARK